MNGISSSQRWSAYATMTSSFIAIFFWHGFELCWTPFPSYLSYLNFHPLKVVSRCRDPQLQVGENYSYFSNLRQNIYSSHWKNIKNIEKNKSRDYRVSAIFGQKNSLIFPWVFPYGFQNSRITISTYFHLLQAILLRRVNICTRETTDWQLLLLSSSDSLTC